MKKWVEKLIEQFDFEWTDTAGGNGGKTPSLSEDRATLLYVIDTFNKHLIEVEGHPVRKVREMLDQFAKEMLQPPQGMQDKIMFRFRQFFTGYRIDECAYFQKTFEDFRAIIWDFVDQLSQDMSEEQKEDAQIRGHLDELKEAVESNSIESLKQESRKFIDCYVEKQFLKEKRSNSRMKSIRKNLNVMKKQLATANDVARMDHLTGAFNRKSFDEYAEQHVRLCSVSGQPVSMLMLDIDHFKRINDMFGHPFGDFVLKELVKILKGQCARELDFVARIGGEEFAILLPDFQQQHAQKKADDLLARIRQEAYAHEGQKINFTISIGIAQLMPGEDKSSWMKRADLALYHSKNTGRNRATVAPGPAPKAA